MDRNIVTKNDQDRAIIKKRKVLREQIENDGQSPTDRMLGEVSVPEADQPIARLAKYIPGEALGLYLALAGIIESGNIREDSRLSWAIGLIALCVVFNFLYLRRIWAVRRVSQIVVSCFALVIYAFATGNELVKSVPGYSELAATVALVAVTTFLVFFEPPTIQESPA